MLLLGVLCVSPSTEGFSATVTGRACGRLVGVGGVVGGWDAEG